MAENPVAYAQGRKNIVNNGVQIFLEEDRRCEGVNGLQPSFRDLDVTVLEYIILTSYSGELS